MMCQANVRNRQILSEYRKSLCLFTINSGLKPPSGRLSVMRTIKVYRHRLYCQGMLIADLLGGYKSKLVI